MIFFFLGGGGGKKKKSFRYEDFLHGFFGSSQNWAIFKGHFYAF